MVTNGCYPIQQCNIVNVNICEFPVQIIFINLCNFVKRCSGKDVVYLSYYVDYFYVLKIKF